MATASPSLEHLRMFVAVVDCGSFSAAARLLERSQPVVSYGIAMMESQLGLTLFERGRRRPVLTASGGAILAYARRMCLLGDELRASAAGLTQGLEGVLHLAVDSFFPTPVLTLALADLAAQHPSVSAEIHIGSRDSVLAEVMDRKAVLGVTAIDLAWPQGVEAQDFGLVEIIPVVSPSHVLAQSPHDIPTSIIRDCIQITNKIARGDEGRDVAVNSTRPWRVDDLATQLALLRAGIGWGYMPRHIADAEIAADRLVRLYPATRSVGVMPYSLIHRADFPPGPAGRLLGERLRHHV